jgi:hypothetical protein
MLFALGAASSAVDALQSLISSKSTSTQTTGFTQNPPTPFDTANGSTQTESPLPVTGGAAFTQISPATMSALIAAQGQDSSASTTSASTTSAPTDPASALKDLFSQIDANGDGQISQSEFENALGAGGTNIAQADDVFNKLDQNGDGSVSLDEMSSALKGAGGKGGGHHHAHVGGSSGSGGSADASGTGNSSTPGGSSTDPLLQALAGLSQPATTSSSSATSSYNMLTQMIQREASAISFSPTSLSFNA